MSEQIGTFGGSGDWLEGAVLSFERLYNDLEIKYEPGLSDAPFGLRLEVIRAEVEIARALSASEKGDA
jgi:hypothetical protein